MKTTIFISYMIIKRYKWFLAAFILVSIFVMECFAAGRNSTLVSNAVLPVKDFTGREEILKKIDRELNSDGLISLVGVTGIGKTQIARKYASDNANKYKLIWFFDCQKNPEYQYQWLAKTINQSICKDRNVCHVEENLQHAVESVNFFLKNEKSAWLLIYDNNTVANNIYWPAYFPPIGLNPKHHILTASQTITYWGNRIDILPFTNAESSEFLEKNLNIKQIDLQQLAKSSNNYPILLAKIAYYLKENPYVTVDELLMLKKRQKEPGDKEQLRNFLKNILLKKIRENPEAYRFLLRCILLDHRNISKEIMKSWQLAQNSISTNDSFIVGLDHLTRYAILQYKSITMAKNTEHTFEMHDFLHKELKELLDSRELSQEFQQLVEMINKWFPDEMYDLDKVMADYPLLLSNLEAILGNFDSYNIPWSAEFAFKVNLLAIYTNYIFNDDSIKNILNWVDRTFEKNFNKGDLKQVELAGTYYLQKSYYHYVHHDSKEAIESGNKVVELSYKVPEGVLWRFPAYSVLAQTYAFINGDLDNAKKSIALAEEIINIGTTDKGRELNATGVFYSTKALIEAAGGEYLKALESKEKAIMENSKEFGITQFTALPIISKAEILAILGRFTEARETLEIINSRLPDEKKQYNEIAPYWLSVEALICAELGDTAKAQTHIDQSIQLLKKFYNLDDTIEEAVNKDVAYVLSIRGAINYKLGMFKEAFADYKNALSIYQKLYQKLTLDNLSILILDLAKTALKLKDKFSFNSYKLLHEENFGIDHPRTRQLYELELKGVY